MASYVFDRVARMKPQTDDNPIPPYSENYTKEQKVHFLEWLVDVIHRGDPTDAIGSDMLSAMHVIDAIKKDVGSQMTKTARLRSTPTSPRSSSNVKQ